MGIRDLFNANADLLLDADTGLSKEWTYTPPQNGAEAIPFDGIFDQSAASGLDQFPARGDERHESGILEVPITITISNNGIMTRVSDNSQWTIQGVISKDVAMQSVSLTKYDRDTARQAARRGA